MFASNLFQHIPEVLAPTIYPLDKLRFGLLLDKLRLAKVTVDGSCHHLFSPEMAQNGGMLMDFVSGKQLEELMRNEKFVKCPTKMLDGLGRVLAVDCILNNVDRLPLIWTHAGNPTNLLISAEMDLHCIDQCFADIQDQRNTDVYLNKVKTAIKEACDKDLEGEFFGKKFFPFLKKVASESTVQDMHVVMQAFLDVFRRCAEDDINIMETLMKTMEAFKGLAPEFKSIEDQFKTLNVNFAIAVMEQGGAYYLECLK